MRNFFKGKKGKLRLLRGALFLLLLFAIWFDWSLWRVVSTAQSYSLPEKPADVILVLGCGALGNGTPSFCQRARVTAAVQLWQAGYAPYLMMTGGKAYDTTEAKIMTELAVAQGVPPDQILQENRSRSTVENMRFSQRLLAERNLRKVLLVTEPFHMYRARKIAAGEGVDVVGWRPAIESLNWQGTRQRLYYLLLDTRSLIVYEVAGGLVYNEDLGFSP